MTVTRFLFIANDVPLGPAKAVSADVIMRSLLQKGFWALTEGAPHRANLQKGDSVVIYLAGPGRRFFAAEAVVDSGCGLISPDQKLSLDGLGLGFFRYSVRVSDARVFDPPVPIRPLIDQFTFITDKQNYGLHLRAPVVRISEKDYQLITHAVSGFEAV